MAGSQRLLYRSDARVTPPNVSARAVRGELCLRAEVDARRHTVLAYRQAAGAFHLSKSYWDDHALMVQWVNPTAGVFAGDVLTSDVAVGPGAALLVTTPSATRIHTRMDPAAFPGEQRQHFQVASGGCLEVQPEWLIPQRGSAFVQRTTIDVAAGGRLFYAELLAPGRVAHNEVLLFDTLDLRLRLQVAGRRVVQERLHATAPNQMWMLQSRDGDALFTATVFIVLPSQAKQAASMALEALARHALCQSGVSPLDEDVLAIRLTARQGLLIKAALRTLREAMVPLCAPLRCELRKL